MLLRNAYTRLIASLLCAFALVSCSEGAPITTPVKIVMLGDSLTAGYQIPVNAAVPAHMQNLFLASGHTGVRVVNMGISGDTTQNGLARLKLTLDTQPDIVVLELGANDILQRVPASDARTNLAHIIEALQARDIIVVLCGVRIPGVFVLGNKYLGEYKPMFDDLADTYDLEFYPNFLNGVQGNSSLNLPDGLHPNERGAQEIASRLYPQLLKTAREFAEHQ